MATIWQKLEECLKHVDEPFRRSEIIGWFRRHHPEVKEQSLAAHIQAATDGGSRSGFEARTPLLTRIAHGEYIRFRPSERKPFAETNRDPAPTEERMTATPDRRRHIGLVSCSAQKISRPQAAADLYTGVAFRKARAHVERTADSWFILSARYGLLAPDDVIGPYDVRLSDRSTSYRDAWGGWVVAQLEDVVGALRGLTIEIHAGQTYIQPILERLRSAGAKVTEPLTGLRQGGRLAWYGEGDSPQVGSVGEQQLALLVQQLRDGTRALRPDDLAERAPMALREPGLYSWWVDADGADILSRGLGHVVEPGLIYAGLAGATRWPSGGRSTNTLKGRQLDTHLAPNASFSTFRMTLAAALRAVLDWEGVDEESLTLWMRQHLRVVPIAFEDRDSLGLVETDVLRELNPPLNLGKMPSSPLRQRLTELRRELGVR